MQRLRVAVAAHLALDPDRFPVSPSRSPRKRQEVESSLAAEIERLGFDVALEACIEVAGIARRKGRDVYSLAYFPGWLATVRPDPIERVKRDIAVQ